MINADSIVPLYQQVSDDIKRKIQTNELHQGDRIGSISELIKEYGVSRVTVIAAIEDLVKSGYVVSKQGKGTFVKDGFTSDQLTSLRSFQEIRRRDEKNFSSKVVRFERIKLPQGLIDEFNSGEEGFIIHRAHYYKGKPVGLICMTFPEQLIPFCEENRELMESNSMYKLLADNGYEIATATQTIYASGASDEIANILEMEPNTPILYAERTSYDKYGNVYMVSMFYYNSDSYSYRITLNRNEDHLSSSFEEV